MHLDPYLFEILANDPYLPYFLVTVLVIVDLLIIIPIYIFGNISINAYDNSYALTMKSLLQYAETLKKWNKFLFFKGLEYSEEKNAKILSTAYTLSAILISYSLSNWIFYISIVLLATNIVIFVVVNHDIKMFQRWDKLSI